MTYSDGSSDQTTYNGLMVTRANAKSQTITSYSHANGAVAETLDALGNATTYAVGAFGMVLSVTDPASTVSYTYDTLGRRLTETDPDTNTNGAPGTTTVTYSSFGQVLTRVTPLELSEGYSESMVYDTQGRMTQRNEPSLSSTWIYDAVSGTPCNNNTSGTGTTTSIGLLCEATTTGTATVSGGYIRNQKYDLYDRPASTQLTLGGVVQPAVTTNYDSGLQLYAGTVFPDGNSTTWKYQGDGHTNGYAQEIDGKIGSTQTTLYTVQTRDAALRPLQTTTGDGLITSRAYDVAERLVWQATGSQAASPPSSVCATSFALPSPSPIQDVGYCRDTISVPNVISRTDAVNLVSDSYTYNALQELKTTATTTAVGQSS